MTRPIFEPSQARATRKLGFGSDQLFRRPAPSSSFGAWARFQRISDSDITILNQTNTIVGGTTGQDINTDPSIFQINTSSEIEMLADGIIGVWAQTVWGTYDTTFRQISVQDINASPDVIYVMGGSGSDLYDPVVIGGIVRISAGAKLVIVVNQHSGGGQTIYGGGSSPDDTNFLEIEYLGAWQTP